MVAATKYEPNHKTLTRAVLAALAVLGAFLIVLPLAIGLPGKSAASGNLMNAFRPQMSSTALAQSQTDAQTMGAMAVQLNTQMIPALAAQMHMTPQQLSAYLAGNFPAVGKGMTEFATILPFFHNLQATMLAQQANFQQADQIPTGSLPPTTMSVLYIVPGVLLLLIGGIGLYRPRYGRRFIAAGSAVGLVLVAGLFSVSMYGKASSADTMTAAFKPIFTTQSVQNARAYTNTVEAMSTQFAQQTLPAVAAALHVTPLQLNTLVAKDFPAVAAGVTQLPQIIVRMDTATRLIQANVDNFNQSAAIPWTPGSMVAMFWFMMIPGLLAFALGAGALAFTQPRRSVVLRQRPAHGAMHS
jgi:hypothetical protein